MSYSECEYKFYDDPLMPSEESDREEICPADPFDMSKPSPFIEVKQNLYLSDNNRSTSRKEKKNKRLECACIFDPAVDKPEEACGDNCLNRMMMIECTSKCKLGDFCTNKHFQRTQYATAEVFRTVCKGWGLRATQYIPSGSFIMEYCGEVCSLTEFGERKRRYEQEKRRHYYFMSLSADEIIDATKMGNYSRFINHSCEPNAETQKWNVCGQIRVGFFALLDIAKNEEITFDYQYERFTSSKMQKCFCGSKYCRGYLGAPKETKQDMTRKIKTPAKRKINIIEPEETNIQTNTIVYIHTVPIKSDATTSIVLQPKTEIVVKTETNSPNPKVENTLTLKATRNGVKSTDTGHCTSSNVSVVEQVKSEEQIFEEKFARILGKEGELATEKQIISLVNLMSKTKCDIHHRQSLLVLLHKSGKSMLKKFVANNGLQAITLWMQDAPRNALAYRSACLKVLSNIQISYKNIQDESKLVNIIERWTKVIQESSENLVSTTTRGNSTSPESTTQNSNISNNAIEDCQEVEKFLGVTTQQVEKEASKILDKWKSICSVYTAPKKEKISQPEEKHSVENEIPIEKDPKPTVEVVKKRTRSRSKDREHESSKEKDKSKKDHEHDKVRDREKSRHRERREEKDRNRHYSSSSSITGKSLKRHKPHNSHSSKDKHHKAKSHHPKTLSASPIKKKENRNESIASEASTIGGMRTTPISSPNSITSEEKDVTPCTPTVKQLSKLVKKESSSLSSKNNDQLMHIPKRKHPIVTQDPLPVLPNKPECEKNNVLQKTQTKDIQPKHPQIPQEQHQQQQQQLQQQLQPHKRPIPLTDEKSEYKRPKKPRKQTISYPNYGPENPDYFINHQHLIPPTDEFFPQEPPYYGYPNPPQVPTPIGYPIPVQTVSVNTSLQLPPTVLSASSDSKLALLTAQAELFSASGKAREPPPPGVAPPLPTTQPKEHTPPPPPPLPQELCAVLNDPCLASAFAKSLTEIPLGLAASDKNIQLFDPQHLTQANAASINKSSELMQAFQTIKRHLSPENMTQQILLAVLIQSMLPNNNFNAFSSPLTSPVMDNTNILTSLINSLTMSKQQQNVVHNPLKELNALTATLLNTQPPHIENPLSFLTNPALSILLSQQSQQQQQQQQYQQVAQQIQSVKNTTTTTTTLKETDPPPPPPPVELPLNWRETTDPSGKSYYYNTVTRETRWERPVETAFYQSPVRTTTNSTANENYSPIIPTVRNHRPLVPGTDPISPNSDGTISPYESCDEKERCFTENEILRENFKQKVSKHVIGLLGEYRKPDCKYGRISATDDFKYLARKLTYAIIEKETHRKGFENELLFNDSVRVKATEFLRSYMKKFGPQFKRILAA